MGNCAYLLIPLTVSQHSGASALVYSRWRGRARAEVSVLEAGVDMVEIDRVARLVRRYGDRFRARVYTDREWADCAGRVESLAARFAAKEATIKALGSREPGLREIEVRRAPESRPRIRLLGRAAEIARGQGVRELALSLSHARHHAVAVVVLLREGRATAPWESEDA